MSRTSSQTFWVPGGATFRLPPRMRLAAAERERLWKGLERFVNCTDTESDYQAMKAFRDFWPLEIWHYPQQESGALSNGSSVALQPEPYESEQRDKESVEPADFARLDWHPVCHKLFLFYRDTLRAIWSGETEIERSAINTGTFLLGLSNLGEDSLAQAKEGNPVGLLMSMTPFPLYDAWEEILSRFKTAATRGGIQIKALWKYGDFAFVPENDFQRAVYILFRQSWRARICPRCQMYFVARRPKQTFCGTGCSAGSRLASKLKWWKRVGKKRRSTESKIAPKQHRKDRSRQ
jgi:hypothetical protein